MADDSPEAPARALERAGKLKKQQQQPEDVAVDVAALEAEDDRDDPQRVWARVQANLEELTHLAQKRREGATRSRASIIEELASDLSSYYEFLRELVDLFLTIFSPHECVEFLDASVKPRPVVARCNTLKARRKDVAAALVKRGCTVEPLAAWSKVGLKINRSDVPVGATPEYLAGWYMLQSAASQCPVLALDPKPGERILELCAAPGGKSSYCAQLMKNQGVLIANDLKRDRHKATTANLHRLGVKIAAVVCQDGRAFPGVMGGFDRVLLDAPCTGLGVCARDPSIQGSRTVEDVKKIAHLQKELLLAAIDSCDAKKAGVVVYSTCSVSVEENEAVVQYALDKRSVKIVPSEALDFARPGFLRCGSRRFHPSMANARRFYPHTHNMDGFFVCKLRVLGKKDKKRKVRD